MITFDIAPNETLKESLAGKLSPFLIATSRIPVFGVSDNYKEVVERIKRTGDTEFLAKIITKRIRKTLAPYQKEYDNYIKKYLEGEECLTGSFSLYLYDNKRDEYITYVQSPSGEAEKLRIDNAFLKFAFPRFFDKGGDKTAAIVEIMIHELFTVVAHFDMGGRFVPITAEEYRREFDYGETENV